MKKKRLGLVFIVLLGQMIILLYIYIYIEEGTTKEKNNEFDPILSSFILMTLCL